MVENAYYLGDGAYVKEDSVTGDVIIYTYDGIHVTNEVYLSQYEISILAKWLRLQRLLGKKLQPNSSMFRN